MRPVLLLLAVLLATLPAKGARRSPKLTPVEAVPKTQIEEPPVEDDNDPDDDNDAAVEDDGDGEDEEDEEGDEDGEEDSDDDGYDIDFHVNRPTTPGSEDEGCVQDQQEGDNDCEKPAMKNLQPYKKYKGYLKWKRIPLFVIIVGGLRWDYMNKGIEMKSFNYIKKRGTTLSQVVPVFPPYDLPTWTALSTGLYPDDTGVLGDYMFNLKTRDLFDRDASGESLENWWIHGEPIWSVAAKHGRKVSVLNWHDCSLPGKNIEEPKDCKPFVSNCPEVTDGSPDRCISNRKPSMLFNRAFTKIQEGYDLSVVYIDQLKRAAKKYGPNSQEMLDELVKLDKMLQARLSDIKTKKERANLKLNIMLISDYGLNGINTTTKVILDEFLNFDHVQYIIQRGGSCVLVPYALKAGDIMRGVGDKKGVSNMVGINAYVRDNNLEVPPLDFETIPDDLHYDGLTWTQDILLVSKPGFEIVINDMDNPKILPPFREEEQGQSGYEPIPATPYIKPGREKHKTKEERAREKKEVELYKEFAHSMKTIGFAWGPDFKVGYTSEPIEIVDFYQLMTFLLKVPPNYHEGDWSRVRPMLTISGSPKQLSSPYLSLLLSALISAFCLSR